MLYTAQYRYPGKDRQDITVAGKSYAGKLYGPTWDMVRSVKNKIMSEDRYTELYYQLLTDRWKTEPEMRNTTLQMVQRLETEDVTFVCFCPANTFCHRFLLVSWITHNWPKVKYGGERTL